MPNYLGDEKLKFLQTKYNYGKLDSGWDIYEYDILYNEAKNILDENKGLENDSNKILRALYYVYKNRLTGNIESDICNFLYYWLGDILLEKLEKNLFFYDIISKLFKILISKNKHRLCELPHSYMYNNEFQDYKLIFDCSEDYKSYKVQHIYSIMPCSKNYMTHLERNVNIYKKLEDLKKPYCDTFREYFPDKTSDLFSQFNCRLETRNPTVGQLEEQKGAQELLQEGQMIGGLQQEEKNFVVTEIGVSPVQHPSSSDSYVNRVDSQMGDNSLPSDGTPSSITSKSVTGAVSVAGALVPSYLLYNYTPAGNLINKLLGRTRMNHNPLTEEQLMNNFYQPEGFNSERSGYNISYRPV
ncbi:PIR protein [Plasmodium vivax]|uniref:VIR protein n=1 Tax=Plasmodium vivax TaxID=5855 RepID=A0A564ZNY8_PLAVI|nr:PIR protein [Plasmodium vivax]